MSKQEAQDLTGNPSNGVLPLWRRGTFYIEAYGEALFTGWTDGESWNGWATPRFEEEVGRRIVEVHNSIEPWNPDDEGSAWYEEESDRFVFITEGTDQEKEYYEGYTKDLEGQVRKLYAIGTRYWTWEEYRIEEIQSDT